MAQDRVGVWKSPLLREARRGHKLTNLGDPRPLVAPGVVLVLAYRTLVARFLAAASESESVQGLAAPAQSALFLLRADRGLHRSP